MDRLLSLRVLKAPYHLEDSNTKHQAIKILKLLVKICVIQQKLRRAKGTIMIFS